MRLLLGDSSPVGFSASPSSVAASLLGEYYAFERVESAARINALARGNPSAFPVVISMPDSSPGTGVVRRSLVSPLDVILVIGTTRDETLASAMSALLDSRERDGAIPTSAFSVIVPETDAPEALGLPPAAALREIRAIPPRPLNGIGTCPWIRVSPWIAEARGCKAPIDRASYCQTRSPAAGTRPSVPNMRAEVAPRPSSGYLEWLCCPLTSAPWSQRPRRSKATSRPTIPSGLRQIPARWTGSTSKGGFPVPETAASTSAAGCPVP